MKRLKIKLKQCGNVKMKYKFVNLSIMNLHHQLVRVILINLHYFVMYEVSLTQGMKYSLFRKAEDMHRQIQFTQKDI